jgi:hypothetical protein
MKTDDPTVVEVKVAVCGASLDKPMVTPPAGAGFARVMDPVTLWLAPMVV